MGMKVFDLRMPLAVDVSAPSRSEGNAAVVGGVDTRCAVVVVVIVIVVDVITVMMVARAGPKRGVDASGGGGGVEISAVELEADVSVFGILVATDTTAFCRGATGFAVGGFGWGGVVGDDGGGVGDGLGGWGEVEGGFGGFGGGGTGDGDFVGGVGVWVGYVSLEVFGGWSGESGRWNTFGSSSFSTAFASAGCVGSLLFSLFVPLESFFIADIAIAAALGFFQTAFTDFMVDSNVFVGIGVGKRVFAVQRG